MTSKRVIFPFPRIKKKNKNKKRLVPLGYVCTLFIQQRYSIQQTTTSTYKTNNTMFHIFSSSSLTIRALSLSLYKSSFPIIEFFSHSFSLSLSLLQALHLWDRKLLWSCIHGGNIIYLISLSFLFFVFYFMNVLYSRTWFIHQYVPKQTCSFSFFSLMFLPFPFFFLY